ncbi:MAG: polysaccharide deacetylase family protein [Clostridia bacterium]|nr:polysaccharide deacetylase family protein [Clostridia bacterium]
MYKYIYATILTICLVLLSACSANTSPKQQFNAYLPPFDTFFEEEIVPLESKNTTEDAVWNTDDVDISYIQPNRKLVALTFDDSPSKTLESILAVFAEYNENNPDCLATATLFLNSGLITQESLPSLHAATALGFELGNHTKSHFDLTALSAEVLQAEIDDTDQMLSSVDRKPRHLLRPPFGRVNDFVKSQVSTPIINWSIDTLDWAKTPAEDIYNGILENLFSGAIVLMHDGYPATVDALKRLLPDLKNMGYQVVSVSALAKAHGCVLRSGSEYIRLRKQ